jgi:hypothetical protein
MQIIHKFHLTNFLHPFYELLTLNPAIGRISPEFCAQRCWVSQTTHNFPIGTLCCRPFFATTVEGSLELILP